MAVRIAFIGANEQAVAHWNSLRGEAHIECVGVCDANMARAKTLAKMSGAPAFSSARALFEAVQADAVWICLAPHAHRDAEILTAQNGCAMLIEAPIAASLETVKRIRREVKEHQVLCVPSLPVRYDVAWQRARKMVGALMQISAQTSASVAQIDATKSRGAKKDLFALFSPHAAPICDAMRVCGRGVQSVFAVSSGDETHFHLAATLVLSSGVLGQWSLHLAPRAKVQTRWFLSGQNGHAHIEAGAFRFERGEETVFWHDSQFGASSGLAEQNRTFLEAVKDGKRAAIRGNYDDATQNLRVLLAIEQSLQTRQIVKLGRA